ncbi:hypothetical protein RQP46_010784 [Phenoliferia psychrophenolica]
MTDLPRDVANSLRDLADSVLQSRTDASTSSVPFDPTSALKASTPLFAYLQTVNREAALHSKACKDKTSAARLEMDRAHLRLQNLKFEQNHLEQEIRKCEEYESEYLSLPLLSPEEFYALATSPTPPPGLPVPLPTDPHELQLVRLNHELAERQRLDEEKKELGARKGKLVKENEVKKQRLEELEKQLEAFVVARLLVNAKSIQTKMNDE